MKVPVIILTVMCISCMVQMVSARLFERKMEKNIHGGGEVIQASKRAFELPGMACQCGFSLVDEKNKFYCDACRCNCGQCYDPEKDKMVCCPCDCNCPCYYKDKGSYQCCSDCSCSCGKCSYASFAILLDHEGMHEYCCKCKSNGGGGGGDKIKGGRGYFPASARLSLKNGKSVAMSELQIGDKVQTASLDGKISYSPVRTYLDKQTTVVTKYKSISTSLNTSISLTGNHLIYARKSGTYQFDAIYADELSVGDEVLVKGNDNFSLAKVNNVSDIMMQGAFVPLTVDGTVIVDGILASCYASSDHDLTHIGMAPIRWFPEILQVIYGMQNGSPGYVKIAKELSRWIDHDKLY